MTVHPRDKLGTQPDFSARIWLMALAVFALGVTLIWWLT